MDALYFAVEKTALAFLAVTMSLLFVQTVLRFGLNVSLSWAEELCRYLCIWLTMLGSGIGIRKNIHVGFDLLKNKLPEKSRQVLKHAISIGLIGFSVLLATNGFSLLRQVSSQLSASMGISMGYAYAAIFAGAVLIGVFSLESILRKEGAKNVGGQ